MIDTHAHINIKELSSKIDEILLNAKNKGVNQIIAIGMDYKTSKEAIRLAMEYDEIYATVGIHPSFVKGSNHHLLNELYNNEKVVAVGEIGIDLYHDYNKKTFDLQKKVFEEQLLKAIKLDLPVVIHIRNSFEETYQIVKKYKGKTRGVFHCFSSDLKDAQKVIDLGFYIGLDGPITFKRNNEELLEIVRNIDLKHILIETDSPYLSPEPFRGKRNEPANVYYVAKKIAEIKNIELDEVIKTTTQNAFELFGIRR